MSSISSFSPAVEKPTGSLSYEWEEVVHNREFNIKEEEGSPYIINNSGDYHYFQYPLKDGYKNPAVCPALAVIDIEVTGKAELFFSTLLNDAPWMNRTDMEYLFTFIDAKGEHLGEFYQNYNPGFMVYPGGAMRRMLIHPNAQLLRITPYFTGGNWHGVMQESPAKFNLIVHGFLSSI